MGHDFQAELPPCFVGGKRSQAWSPEVESPREQLLWKPWDKLEENTNLQDQGTWHDDIQLMLELHTSNFLNRPVLSYNCTKNASKFSILLHYDQ